MVIGCDNYLAPNGMPSQCILDYLNMSIYLVIVPFCLWSILGHLHGPKRVSVSKLRYIGFAAGCLSLLGQNLAHVPVFLLLLADEWLQLGKSQLCGGQQLFFYAIQFTLGLFGYSYGTRRFYACFVCFFAFLFEFLGSNTQPYGYDNSTIFGKLGVSFVNHMLKVSLKGQIQREDFAKCPKNLSSAQSFVSLSEQLTRTNLKCLWAVLRFNKWRLISTIFLQVIVTLCTYIRPLILALFLKSLAMYQKGEQDVYPSIYLGALSGGVQLINPALGSLVSNINTMMSTMTRAALMETIYRKAAVLSNESRVVYDSAKIMNLLNVDTAIIQNCYQYFPSLIEAPLGMVACTWQLYHFIGNASFAAIPVYMVFIPYSSWHTKRMFKRFPELMKAKDVRTKSLWGVFRNIKSLKLYAWEEPYEKQVASDRNQEIGVQQKYLKLISIMRSLTIMMDDLVASAVFIAFLYYSGQALTPEIVFPTLSLLSFLSDPFTSLPSAVSGLGRTLTSQDRINAFLAQPEHQSLNYSQNDYEHGIPTVQVNDATISWNETVALERAVIKNMDLHLGPGDLCCIVGRVGSGKTGFLRALCDQMHISSGSVAINGTIAYCPQEPWLQFKSVRENIVFGLAFDEDYYRKTIEACELLTDIKNLPKGDMTQVGEKGICLSGGQKARVALARAVYSRADVFILDDVLSAVDEHVSRSLVKNLLSPTGILAGKTIVLGTNSKPVLRHASLIVNLDSDGKHAIRTTNAQEGSSQVDTDSSVPGTPSLTSRATTPVLKQIEQGTKMLTRDLFNVCDRIQQLELAVDAPEPVLKTEDSFEALHEQLGDEEHDQRANVFAVFGRYFRSVGRLNVILTVIFFACAILFPNLILIWLTLWSDKGVAGLSAAKFYVMVYVFLSICTGTFVYLSVYWFHGRIGYTASKVLHEKMVDCVLKSPLTFFDKTPMGAIMNRFTGDISTLDQTVPNVLYNFYRTALMAVASFAITLFGAPLLIFILVPSLVIYNNYRRAYIPCSRQLQRIMSASRGPILSHIEESVKGVSTIGAFSRWPQFVESYQIRSDYWMEAVFLNSSLGRWLNWRIRVITVTITWCVAASMIALVSIHPLFTIGLVGVVMHSTQKASMLLSRIIRNAANIEVSAVAVERIFEFCDLENEAARETSYDPNPKERPWPPSGQVEFKDYSTRYRPELPIVLKNINVCFNAREKIGVVGRTGAAKSTLCLAIFRMLEASGGEIQIDDWDISKLGLKTLRRNLSIIPQDAQIFSGTLRHNLDPLNDASDAKLRNVLKLCHLEQHFFHNLDTGLDTELLEGGENLSRGQAQLICLGRALLHDSGILVLDEATASVDTETDQIVQQTIRSEFKHKTIITIAHRLNTIMDCDRILVLDHGQVKEFDTPQNLLDAKGEFYSLAQNPEELA